MKNQQKDFSGGFSTIEILVALAVFVTGVCAGVMALWYERALALEAEMSQRALLVTKRYLEQAKGDLKQDFFASVDRAAYEDSFSIVVSSESLSPTVKRILVQATWPWELSTSNKFSLSAQVTDVGGTFGSDTCATGFSGNWQNPVLHGSITLGQNNPATGVDAVGGKAYVTTNGSTASLKDFYIIGGDIDHPAILGKVDTGPGLNAVHVAGKYAYVANSSINGQLEVIDISNSSNPVLIQHVKFADAGSGGTGNSIFYYRGKVYIGALINNGPEFYVYDVQNPLAPVFKGAFEIGSGVNKIYVYGNYAYIATGDINRFRVLKIDDPAHITEVGEFSDGEMGTAQSGESVAMLNGKAVFGRAGGLPNAHIPELFLLDNLEGHGQINKLSSADINMSINGIFMRGGKAFLATNKDDGEFQIYNLANNGLSPYSFVNLPATATGIDCEGENFYLALDGDPILQIVSPGS